MKTTFCITLAAIAAAFSCTSKRDLVKENFDFAEGQTKNLLVEAAPQMPRMPRTVRLDTLETVDVYDWVSGFFPGTLWYLYENSQSDFWRNEAERWTALMEPVQHFSGHHDVGFMMQCSYGNAYRLTHDERYKPILVQAARSLCRRFNPVVGSLKSWEVSTSQAQRGWQFPVIIDNMMNLELLFNATKFSGDSTFYKIAVTHANTTLRNHFRPDHSSYHVVNYDTTTGAAMLYETAQGYANESAWARGQAWGLYGFTMCYRETREPQFLQQAQSIAAFITSNPKIPNDHIPYWDYDAPNVPNEPRDASAAAITASALLQLATLCPDDAATAEGYRQYARSILESLSTPAYRAAAGSNHGFLLLHSVGSIPHNTEIDVPLNYADYYFLEALLLSKKGE
ncbi:MAG: glycoside hydrolase family 88 protein [Prevotellaceae bacterium]|jgi:hypothetical protein|nr:glycoside hydrolase family 88 protein [Prevotellaceae bacterium]